MLKLNIKLIFILSIIMFNSFTSSGQVMKPGSSPFRRLLLYEQRYDSCQHEMAKLKKIVKTLDQENSVLREYILTLKKEQMILRDSMFTLMSLALADFRKAEILINDLKRGHSTPHYDINVLPDNELVKGKEGIYFLIEFKNPDLQEKLYFDLEKYSIDSFDKKYQKSINRFSLEILKIIESSSVREYEIFIRGSADIDKPPYFERALIKRYNFNEITVLKRDPGNEQYLFDEYIHRVPNYYTNRQLPDLRARFIQNVLTNPPYSESPYSFKREKVHILQGGETKFVDKTDRNVSIILYTAK